MHKCSHPLVKKDKNPMSEYIGIDEYCRTFVLGCASHPLALKTLITPIIIELETQKALAHKRMNNYLDMGHDGNWQGGKEEGFEEAIEILRSS
jgi:hypothetical protein